MLDERDTVSLLRYTWAFNIMELHDGALPLMSSRCEQHKAKPDKLWKPLNVSLPR